MAGLYQTITLKIVPVSPRPQANYLHTLRVEILATVQFLFQLIYHLINISIPYLSNVPFHEKRPRCFHRGCQLMYRSMFGTYF